MSKLLILLCFICPLRLFAQSTIYEQDFESVQDGANAGQWATGGKAWTGVASTPLPTDPNPRRLPRPA
jgi:hypothetical protein